MHDDDFHLESEHEHDHDAADSSYSDRQRSRDANYQRDYDRWVKSLPPEERRKLAGMGLGKAEVSHKAGSGFKDLTDSPLCSTPPGEMLSNDDPQLDAAVMPEGESPHEILRRLIGELMHQDHSRLALDCLALVTGLAYEGDSMTEIALRHDVTRAAVSKRCVELTLALNLKHAHPGRTHLLPPVPQSYSRLENDDIGSTEVIDRLGRRQNAVSSLMPQHVPRLEG